MIVERHTLGLPVLGTRCMTIRFSFLMIKFSFLSEREIISIHDLISQKLKVLQRPTRQRQLPCPVVSRHSMCHASLDLMWHWPCIGSLSSRFFLLLYYTKGMTLPFSTGRASWDWHTFPINQNDQKEIQRKTELSLQ